MVVFECAGFFGDVFDPKDVETFNCAKVTSLGAGEFIMAAFIKALRDEREFGALCLKAIEIAF